MIRQNDKPINFQTEVSQKLVLIFLNDNLHEVERQSDVLRVDDRRAVREAVRARHRRELGPLVHGVAGRELLVGRDGLVGRLEGCRIDLFEETIGHELLEGLLELEEAPQRDAAGSRAKRWGGIRRSRG